MLPIRYYVTNKMLVTDRSRCNLGGQSFLSFRYFRISIIRRIMSMASADNAHTSIIVIRILHLPPERILRGKEETSPPTVRVINSIWLLQFLVLCTDLIIQFPISIVKLQFDYKSGGYFALNFFLTIIKNYDILKIKKQPCRRCAPMWVLSLT